MQSFLTWVKRRTVAESAIAGVTVLYVLAASFATLSAGNQEFLLYVAVLMLLMAVVVAVHYRVNLTTATLAALSLWGLLHMAGGLVPVPDNWPIAGDQRVLYSWWLIPGRLKYDQVVHAFGFGVTTWVCWQGLRTALRTPRPTLGVLILCIAGGVGFGALNEVVEFIATLLVPETNVGGYENTGWDLVSNLIGSMIAGTLIRIFDRG